MTLKETTGILKALGDNSRLMIVNALINSPRCVEELAGILGCAVSTASFHLKKLESAGIVQKTKDQYYTVYSVNDDILGMTIRDIAAAVNDGSGQNDTGLEKYRCKIISVFFSDGKLHRLPVQKKKRRIVLEHFICRFDEGRTYNETEVNAIITPMFDDYCTIRRELVDEGLMARIGLQYKRTGPISSLQLHETDVKRRKREIKVNTRSELKRIYRENPPKAGIFRITNRANGKIFIGKAMNVQGKINGQRFELQLGSHRSGTLQNEWNEFGEHNFEFDVIDYLDPDKNPGQDLAGDLAALEEAWLEKLQPFGESGYNRKAVNSK